MPNRPGHILYIDDDPALARLVQKGLARQGYAVDLAHDAAAGLARIGEGGFDVVLLDHDLGTDSGLEVLTALKRRGAGPAVVYVTASSDVALAVQALKAGAADYVLKTVGDDFLVLVESAVQQAVEKVRLQRQKEIADLEMRKARDRAEMLLAEVNHRVANSLALVGSLVRLQMSAVRDPAAREALAETQARITAIAALHRRLYTGEDVQSVDLAAYLASLIEEVRASIAAGRHSPAISLSLESAEIATDRAIAVGMIVVELVTNAIKYAYPDGDGEVRVALRRDAAGALLSVEDDGIGWHGDGKVQGSGLGSRIIAAMAQRLDSAVDYAPAAKGTRASLRIPIAEYRSGCSSD